MEIEFEVINSTGVIKLNRPKSLNALNIEMAKQFSEKLNEWEIDENIDRVLLTGEGNHFCAGGDVKSLVLSKNINNLKQKFFETEYKLNYLISNFSKKYLTLWNGVVMGGGVGLSIYGNYRFANETCKFAMPETAIGFFPDVGGSFFLSNIENNIGKYLALTGKIIEIEDILLLGFATHYYNSNDTKKIINNYISGEKIEKYIYDKSKTTKLIEDSKLIKDFFEGNIFSIVKKLSNSKLDFAKITLDILKKKCPMSLAISCELLDRAKKKSLKECLEMEYQLSQKIVYRDDFDTGIKEVLITKSNKPLWKPESIYDISNNEINKMFEFNKFSLNL